jgi:lysophospholipase L1-like esterase
MRKIRSEMSPILLVISAFMLSITASTVAAQVITLPADQQQAAPVVVAKQPTAVVPVSKPDNGWQNRHKAMNERVKQGNVDLLMVGDSITHFWETSGKDLWNKYYKDRNAVNLGIGGDMTQHVLWRLQNGNIDGISPKLAVLMIGTNNANAGNKPEDIAAGVKAIVDLLRAKLPQTKVLVLAIFPRGADDNDRKRQTNMKANEEIAKLADDKMVFFLDINDKFLDSERKLARNVMPDLLHPNAKGYEIWAEAMEPTVAKLMGEK